MRRANFWLVVLLALALAAGLDTPALRADQAAHEEVKAHLQAYYQALSAKDLERVGQVWSHEPYVRVKGPRSTEFQTGWEAVKTHWQGVFARFEQWSIRLEDPQIEVRDRVAWVSGYDKIEGRLADGQPVTSTVFNTLVLEKQGGAWRTVHAHGSVPPPR
jgi:ketosteroid isomerase-like protein